MTAAEYREAGYEVSINMRQAVIDHAEQVIVHCYVEPMRPEVEPDAADVREATMALAYLYLLTDDYKATPAGGKIKITEQSQQPQKWSVFAHLAGEAVVFLQRLNPAKQWWAVCDDILGLSYNSNFINL